MSALPLAGLAFGGTSDLPSSVAFIFSAKAGPAKAMVAPSASVASVVLVFDMVFSLLASSEGQFQNNRIPVLFPEWTQTPRILRQLMAEIAAILANRLSWTVTDR